MLQIEESGFRGKRQTGDEDQSGSRKGEGWRAYLCKLSDALSAGCWAVCCERLQQWESQLRPLRKDLNDN